ncbi:MAG: phosphoribosylanthranilate isomerase [Ignavibacteriales bacterium]|nr:phosphoribosylanthranilate isomerase [Ignavibacteriales bacterium]
MEKPRVKICCIQSIQEAEVAIRHGASALGLVSEMPSGPGPIPEDRIAEIASSVPRGIETFLLTSKQNADAVVSQQRKTNVTTLQLVDAFPIKGYGILRKFLPRIRIVQVIHVTGGESVKEAIAAAEHVDALLLDSGNPSLPRKELGGTGRTHDWTISRQIRESVDVPVYLAGGLKAENVRHAIDAVSPFAVDLCSGVRTNGALDETKLKAFFAAINA